MIIKIFNSNLLKIEKKSYKNIDIHYIGYITIKDVGDYENIYPLYFIIGEVDEYIEEKNVNKYLAFAVTDKRKKVLTKYIDLWNRIKNLIKTIHYKPDEYG